MAYSVVTTVLSAAASSSLTDLATVKDELSIQAANTSNDAWLARAIRQASLAIANYTRRSFAPEYVREVFDLDQDPYPYQTPGGFSQLQLGRWPVLAVASVAQTLSASASQPLTEGLDFRTDPNSGQLLRLNPFTGVGVTWESLPVSVSYVAGYGALVQETHTVPGSPFKVTASQAAWSCDQVVSYPDGTALTPVAANPARGQYVAAAGVYSFNAADAGQLLSFAYATFSVPDDLVDATLRLVTMRFKGKDRDPMLMSQTQPNLGEQRWWVGSTRGQSGAFPTEIEGLLEEYRSAVVV